MVTGLYFYLAPIFKNITMKKIIIDILKEMGKDEVLFDTPLKIVLGPHQWPLFIYGVSYHKSRLALYDSEIWHELSEGQYNYYVVAGSIYQRLKSLQTKVA